MPIVNVLRALWSKLQPGHSIEVVLVWVDGHLLAKVKGNMGFPGVSSDQIILSLFKGIFVGNGNVLKLLRSALSI